MSAAARITLGAPGIYQYPETTSRELQPERMDVCAFVGVAPRGPCREAVLPETWTGEYALVDPAWPKRRSLAVPVESMEEYTSLYSGFEGPGRLPYAVAAFFEQGGQRAYIVRIVHDYGSDADNVAVASAKLANATLSAGELILRARNEGSWGNALRAVLGYSTRAVTLFSALTSSELAMAPDESIHPGVLLRVHLPDTGSGNAQREFRFVSMVRREGSAASTETILRVTLDAPLPREPEYVEVVSGELLLSDGQDQVEQYSGLGLSSLHPRWMATVLFNESRLVYPEQSWVNSDIKPNDIDALPVTPLFDSADAVDFSGGEDRYQDISLDDFFDSGWVLGDPEPGSGIQALAYLADLSSVTVPDLYVPEPLPAMEDISDVVSLAGAEFAPCVEYADTTVPMADTSNDLIGLYLDPRLPNDLKTIITLQQKVVEFADTLEYFVALLDVPPGLSQRQILHWRANFKSSYVAAYHPWLKISSNQDQRNALIMINPSAVAAGIIAKQEIAFGVPHGPANVIAESVVKVDVIVSPMQHDELHPNGINVYLRTRDGVWLSAARTLSRDSRYRQLSVRRLMLMLRRTLQRQMQWAVFEPNGPALWADMRHMLNAYLHGLFLQGAFSGVQDTDSFFVRCDAGLNTAPVLDAGMMLAEIGVAPAEPLEFIMLRLTRNGDGTLTVEG